MCFTIDNILLISEETGCDGAKFIACDHQFVESFDRSIEFDRCGTRSIVTHQMGYRCASDVFGLALGDALNMKHRLDDTGVYTDNELYARTIPEVVNVSVGYECQHSPGETLDPLYLNRLLDSLCTVDVDSLPIDRDPDKCTEADRRQGGGGYGDSIKDNLPDDLLIELCENYPYEAAVLLAEYGFDSEDLIEAIEDCRDSAPPVEDESAWDYVNEERGE